VHGLQKGVTPPQPSPCSPHAVYAPQVSGAHAPASIATHLLKMQLWPAGQVGQVSSVPQPLSVRPHCRPRLVQVCGWHEEPPSTGTHWLFSQVVPAAHVPQLAVTPPQPFATKPHWAAPQPPGVHPASG
jgi:hypothetical protein